MALAGGAGRTVSDDEHTVALDVSGKDRRGGALAPISHWAAFTAKYSPRGRVQVGPSQPDGGTSCRPLLCCRNRWRSQGSVARPNAETQGHQVPITRKWDRPI